MTLSEELARLDELHRDGALTDAEFAQAKARLLGAAGAMPRPQAPAVAAINGLRRSRDDAWLGGVCGGIAQATGVAAWIWRLTFTLLVMCAGTGVLLYLLMWVLVPKADAPVAMQPDAMRAG
jgi:phage shock protein PspC (stress-responsive transcriptional regulator)